MEKIALKKVQDVSDYIQGKYPKFWLANYKHVNVYNKPMQFGDKYRFLVPLYEHLPENFVCEKAVQCGASELFIVSALEEAARGLRILYVQPNYDLRNVFVKDRLNRLISAVPYYSELLSSVSGGSTSTGLKHFGKGLLNFVGSNTPGQFISFPADSLYIDEVDQCDQENLELAPDRLDASEYKYNRKIGNPSVENWGIDYHYQQSSQASWIIKCDKCNTQQSLDFFKNVIKRTGDMTFDVLDDSEDSQCVCVKCGTLLDRMKRGEWVDKIFNTKIKGARVNQLFSANVNISDITDFYGKALGSARKMQVLYNSKLGLPYSAEGAKISYAMLERARSSYSLRDINPQNYRKIYIGIDVGPYYHYVVRTKLANGQRKLLVAGKCESTAVLVERLKKWRANYIVIDELPETREVEKLKKAMKNLYSCLYKKNRTILDIRRKSLEFRKEHRVAIDRTFILDCVQEDFISNIMLNPEEAKMIGNERREEYGEYYKQLMISTKIFVEEKGRFEWRESGPDHYFHAEAYCKFAELLDPNVIQFYIDKNVEFAKQTQEEQAMQYKKDKPLIPTDIEELKLVRAESFLNSLFYHTEELLSGRKK